LFRALTGDIYPFECGIGNGQKIVNLLMLHTKYDRVKNGEIKKAKSHFLAITDVNKYLSKQYKNKNGRTRYEKAFFCLNCLNKFSLKSALNSHQEICLVNKPILEETKWGYINFKNHHHIHRQDYIGFLDFESTLSPNANHCSNCSSLRCKCDKSFSEIVSHQEPIAFSFVIVDSNNTIIHEYTFAGENAADIFVSHLLECKKQWLSKLLHTKKPMLITTEEQESFNAATYCYMCQQSFKSTHSKNRDHNHFTGAYLGAACEYCNLKRTTPKKLTIFLHNGSKYDFHFIVRALNKKEISKIRVLPYNSEHFRTIEFSGFRFLDSLAFLQASLTQLSNDLAQTSHNYNILKQTNLVKTDGKFDLNKFKAVLHKSFFPYEYCTSFETMTNTRELPAKEHFYSQLNEKSISSDDYNFAQKVWKLFNCRNLVDYTKIYCKIDTILLAEIFQKFRSDMIQFSTLDPSHYMSLPGYSFDSMLKFTKCKLHRLHDIDMVHFIESSIRGGVSFINTRHLTIDENTSEEIIYIDANVSQT
jgi:hypothetical protein